MSRSHTLLGVLSATSVFILGCAPAAPTAAPKSPTQASHGHDHGGHGHEAPKNFAEAVAAAKHMRDEIRDAFAKDDPNAAHDQLHEIGHLLEGLPTFAKSAGLDDAGVATVKEQAEKAFACFEKIDRAMHGKGKPKYEEGAIIDAALDAISGLVK
jgi:Spy/CpxP family protein refolding chaperone